MRKYTLYLLIYALILSGCSQLPEIFASPTPSSTPTYTPTITPTSTPTSTSTPTYTPSPTPIAITKLGTVEKNVTFCTQRGVPVQLDVYYPSTATGLWPVVVMIHGGAWITGDKKSTPDLHAQPGLNAQGILVVSINYRLGGAFPWPSMIEDAKCAVRYLRANAHDYNLDPNHIGAMGDSVGGQLALLLGLTDQTVGWDVGDNLDYSSEVEAIVDFFGPTDLTDDSLALLMTKRGPAAFYNLAFNSPELIKASPITYVKQDAPPIFIAHGDLDTTVPIAQSYLFYDKMKAIGAPICLVVMKNAIHSFAPVYYTVSPTEDEVMAMAVNFFANKLIPSTSLPQPTEDPSLTTCFSQGN
jgi:acetyl esterase/lipase